MSLYVRFNPPEGSYTIRSHSIAHFPTTIQFTQSGNAGRHPPTLHSRLLHPIITLSSPSLSFLYLSSPFSHPLSSSFPSLSTASAAAVKYLYQLPCRPVHCPSTTCASLPSAPPSTTFESGMYVVPCFIGVIHLVYTNLGAGIHNTDSEVRFLSRQGGAHVWCFDNNLVCKQGSRVQNSEEVAMRLMRQHTSVPVADIIFSNYKPGDGSISMSFIPGLQLKLVWMDSMSAPRSGCVVRYG